MSKSETAVEGVKRSSNHLRGDLGQQLHDQSPSVSTDAEQLLKFHGIYAQDNRDVRRARTLAKEPLDHIFMIRVVIPGGRLRAAQWLALDAVADNIADGTIRLTTRQAVQFHGVVKHGLVPLAQSLDEYLLSSFGGCGDVVRNVVMCPHLQLEHDGHELATIANELAVRFRPRTQAHWEIFVNGDRVASRETNDEHPFYGDTYLPRKFKIAVAHPHENCVDVFAQDVGLIPETHPELGPGFTVIVGGGLGRSYANPDTFARLGDPLAFVPKANIDAVIAAIVATYNDLGDRTDRKRARMKYIIADHGLDSFREQVEHRFGATLAPPLPTPASFDGRDHLGWEVAPDGS
jgi:sulfite reductase (ferredoxin)